MLDFAADAAGVELVAKSAREVYGFAAVDGRGGCLLLALLHVQADLGVVLASGYVD